MSLLLNLNNIAANIVFGDNFVCLLKMFFYLFIIIGDLFFGLFRFSFTAVSTLSQFISRPGKQTLINNLVFYS